MKSQKKEITFEILENSELDKISEIGMDGIMLNESDKTRILKASRDKYEKSLTDNSSFRTEDNYKEVKVYRQNRLKTIIPAVICNVALIFLVIGVINVLKKDDYNITVTPPATESTEIQTTTQSDVTTSAPVKYVTVPMVDTSFTVEQFTARLEEEGFNVQYVYQYSDIIFEGDILGTDPIGHSKVAEGSTVKIIISLGNGKNSTEYFGELDNQTYPEYNKVPDLCNCKTFEEAINLASESGFYVQQKFTWSDDLPGTIIETYPPANETLKTGSTVLIITSRGPMYVIEGDILDNVFSKLPDYDEPLLNKCYILFDFNNNSSSEYWIFGNTKDLNYLHIFTLNESEYELSASLTSTEKFKICGPLNAIWTTSESDNNYITNNIYQLSRNDEITMITSFKCGLDTEKNPVSYWHNEKEITENEYTELINDYSQFDWIIPYAEPYLR